MHTYTYTYIYIYIYIYTHTYVYIYRDVERSHIHMYINRDVERSGVQVGSDGLLGILGNSSSSADFGKVYDCLVVGPIGQIKHSDTHARQKQISSL